MRFCRVWRALPFVLLSLGLGACGDDSTGPEDAELTQAEVEALVEALGTVGAFDFDMEAASTVQGGPAAAAVALARVPFSESLSETVPCPEGGNVKVAGTISGDVDEDTGLGTVSFSLAHTHQGCKATAPSSGMTFTFDGDPDIDILASMTLTETGFSLSGTEKGGVEWKKGDRSGSCAVDLAFDFEIGDIFTEEPSGSVTGTVCGRSVSETL